MPAQLLDAGGHIGLQLLAALLREQPELRVHFAADGQLAHEELPVGDVQFVDRQLQRRFVETGLALAPAQVHWLVQGGAEQVVLALVAQQVEFLDQGGFVIQVDGDLVIEIEVKRRRG